MGHKESDPLTELAIDRELRQILAVDPSPEFLARVRMRIANESPSLRFPRIILTGTIGLAVVVAVAISLSISHRQDRSVSERMPTEMPGTGTDSTLNVVPEATGNIAAEERGNYRSPKSRSGTTTPASPDVLVSPDDVMAFRQLMAAVAEHKFAVSLEDTLPEPERQASTSIVIPPIDIEPLSTDEGVHQ